MSFSPVQLYQSPNALAPFYRRFDVERRVLLTGHSHQAWPDCCREAQLEAWDDAALHVDDKWARAAHKAQAVRDGFTRLLDDEHGEIALGCNTHELLTRFLSALPLRHKPRIVTTTGEFHSARRQLDRLAEEGIEIIRVPADSPAAVAGHIQANLTAQTAAVIVSSVFFRSGLIVPNLTEIYQACRHYQCELLIDAYHQLNVVPFSVRDLKLHHAFILGGGYKYCQLGEGNCFLRFPRDCELRPVHSGWFAEFSALERVDTTHDVVYDRGPARFAGATYDPTSHYRAASVFDFFQHHGLTPALLREVSQHQITTLLTELMRTRIISEHFFLDDTIPVEQRAGFLVVTSPIASALKSDLAVANVHVDIRGHQLRLGPAPYLCDDQLRYAVDQIAQAVRRRGEHA